MSTTMASGNTEKCTAREIEVTTLAKAMKVNFAAEKELVGASIPIMGFDTRAIGGTTSYQAERYTWLATKRTRVNFARMNLVYSSIMERGSGLLFMAIVIWATSAMVRSTDLEPGFCLQVQDIGAK